MRKYDLPSAENEEYMDELEKMPRNVIYFLTAFILICVALYCGYLLMGGWQLIFFLLIISSIGVLVCYIRKGILTARQNNKNGKIYKASVQKAK